MHRLVTLVILVFLSLAPSEAQQAEVHPESLKAPVDTSLPHFIAAPEISGHITSVGADTMDDLMKLWIAGFHERQPAVVVELRSQASMSVPAALTKGIAHLAPLSRELNPSEVEAFRARHGYPPTEIAVALGSYRTPTRTVALTFYVNDANPITKLDLQQADAMWCTTLRRGAKQTITEWGQLGLPGDWAHRPIHLVGVQPPDGVPNFIMRRVCNGGALRDGILGEKNGGPSSVLTRIVEDVANDRDAIGYAGFHNRQAGTHPLRIAFAAEEPFYEGTFDEVRTDSFPLTRFVYIYVDRPPATALAPAVREFLGYILSFDGQRDVEHEGIFMPLPARVAAEQRGKLE